MANLPKKSHSRLYRSNNLTSFCAKSIKMLVTSSQKTKMIWAVFRKQTIILSKLDAMLDFRAPMLILKNGLLLLLSRIRKQWVRMWELEYSLWVKFPMANTESTFSDPKIEIESLDITCHPWHKTSYSVWVKVKNSTFLRRTHLRRAPQKRRWFRLAR